jgi:hypothetical protein
LNEEQSQEQTLLEEESSEPSQTGKIFGIIEMLVCSWVFASLGILNRRLSEVDPGVVLFWHSSIGFGLATGALVIYSLATS